MLILLPALLMSLSLDYRKTCFKRPLKMNTKIGFDYQLSLDAGQSIAAVQIVLKSEQQHHKNLAICRSVCRVLANLAASFTDDANS